MQSNIFLKMNPQVMRLKMTDERQLLESISQQFDSLAKNFGLDYYPINFEIVPESFMNEIAVYGLPVRMPHWSYGLRYIHQLIRHSMGNSHIFEVMFPGNPCHAYLVDSNSLAENALVIAHVIGHADFAKNNNLFANFLKMSGNTILERSATHAHTIEIAIEKYGIDRVEKTLDAAIALEQYIDINFNLQRDSFEKLNNVFDDESSFTGKKSINNINKKNDLFKNNKGIKFNKPEYDLLWVIANYASDLEGWERDIFLAVREESFFFYPVFTCQIMNEGWASYWHARLLRESNFIPDDLYLNAVKAHSDVVRPGTGNNQITLSINPYYLGFSIWEDIIERKGLEKARVICKEEDDFSFIRNYLTEQLAEKLEIFSYAINGKGEINISERNIHLIRESIISPKFNFGSPRIGVSEIKTDGSLILAHEFQSDGRGLELESASKVVEYIANVWKKSVYLSTVDSEKKEKVIASLT